MPIAPHTLELTFNRPLQPESTWAAVQREDGPPTPTDTVVEPVNPRRLTVHLQQPAAGQYRLHWHAVAARTAAAADGEQDFALQDESPGAPRIDLSQPTADSGDKLEVKGNGFDKRSSVTLTIGDDAQALNTVETDAHGSFGVDVRIPPGVPFGVQPVSATDGGGGRGHDGRAGPLGRLAAAGGLYGGPTWPSAGRGDVLGERAQSVRLSAGAGARGAGRSGPGRNELRGRRAECQSASREP